MELMIQVKCEEKLYTQWMYVFMHNGAKLISKYR